MAREHIPVIVRYVPGKRATRWSHKCGFTKRNGELCERWAIHGGYVCPKHGGRLPAVRAGARARLASLMPSALDVYAETLHSDREEIRLRAAKDIMRLIGVTASGTRTPDTRRALQGKRAADAPQAIEPPPDVEIEALLGALRELGAGGEAPADERQ